MIPTSPVKTARAPRWLVALGLCWPVPVLYLFFLYGHFSTNAPYGDDMPLIIGRSIEFFTASDWYQKLACIFRSSEEYRVAFLMTVSLLTTKVFGYLNFIFIGGVGMLLMFVGMALFVTRLRADTDVLNFLGLILGLLMASPIYSQCMLWPTCALGHIASLFMGSLACVFLTGRTIKSFVLFEVATLLAILTHGNGLGLYPLGFLGIYLYQAPHQRTRLLIAHGLIFVCVLVVWITTFTVTQNTVAAMNYISTLAASRSGIQMAVNLFSWIVGWFGSWLAFNENINQALLAGAVEIMLLIYMFSKARQQLFSQYAHATFFMLYLVLTIICTSLIRSYGVLPVEFVFSDRFILFSLALGGCTLCVLFCLVNDNALPPLFPGQQFVLAGTLFAGTLVYFAVANYQRFPVLIFFKNQEVMCSRAWTENHLAKPCLWHDDNKILMDRATDLGILYINEYGTEPLRCEKGYLKHCWRPGQAVDANTH